MRNDWRGIWVTGRISTQQGTLMRGVNDEDYSTITVVRKVKKLSGPDWLKEKISLKISFQHKSRCKLAITKCSH